MLVTYNIKEVLAMKYTIAIIMTLMHMNVGTLNGEDVSRIKIILEQGTNAKAHALKRVKISILYH